MDFEKEKRKFSRVSEYDEISYSIIPHPKSKNKLTLDLSAGGIRFIADEFIPLNSLLRLEIRLLHCSKVINAIAKVVRVKSLFGDERFEIGVEFVDIKKEDLVLFKSLYQAPPQESGQ
ncbi:MAG: PilZ domain-containing protein [Candidatus Omnitrophota bacterium]